MLRLKMATQEQELKNNAKQIVLNLPSHLLGKIGTVKREDKPLTKVNPIGQLLKHLVAKKILKRENFLVKLVAGQYLKSVGKKIEKQLT